MRYGLDDVGLDRIIARTMTVNTGSRAVMERVGLTYVRTFPTSTTAPVEGLEEGEVEYEMTREQWQRLRDRTRDARRSARSRPGQASTRMTTAFGLRGVSQAQERGRCEEPAPGSRGQGLPGTGAFTGAHVGVRRHFACK